MVNEFLLLRAARNSHRTEHIAEWVRLTEEKQREVSAQLAPKSQSGRPEGGVNAASRALGTERAEAQRAVKIAGISERAKEAARKRGLALGLERQTAR